MKLSVVVPVFNERKNVALLHERILSVLKKEYKPSAYEIIFVDDGSSDRTFEALCSLKKVKVIRFRKNYGQTAAMRAGIEMAKGDVVVTMDGDLQNDPIDIPRLLLKMQEGFDVVSGWRFRRKDSFGKKMFSRFADKLRKVLINDNIHDSGCSLKAYKKECFENTDDLMGEMHRYIPALLKLQGFSVGEVKVRHYPRRYGKTKYNMRRVLKGFLDLVNVWFWRKYATRPLHMFGAAGIGSVLVGVVLGLFSIYLKLFKGTDLSNTFLPVLAIFLVIIGVQLLVSGLMMDVIVKNHYVSSKKKNYTVKEVVEKK